MAGTELGGKKTARTIKARLGANFYRKIGAIGGRNGHTGGFYGNPERARLAGALGGYRSRRSCSDDDFAQLWIECSIDEMAERLNVRPSSISNRASKLRERGYELPRRRRLL